MIWCCSWNSLIIWFVGTCIFLLLLLLNNDKWRRYAIFCLSMHFLVVFNCLSSKVDFSYVNNHVFIFWMVLEVLKKPSLTPRQKSESNPIPSLPNDLMLSCLARVLRMYYPSLSLVSKRFQSIISSPELYETRSIDWVELSVFR